MTKNRDYNDYDYLEIIVKKENEKQIISAYSEFLWQEIDRKEDRRYSDVVHIEFRRAHKIQNKDRLQLLQVYYESILNQKAEAFIHKHSKSKIGIFLASILYSAIFLGIGALIFYLKSTLTIVLASVILVLSLISVAFIVGFFRKTMDKEKQKFTQKNCEFDNSIKEILYEVTLLSKGEIYEKQD